MNIIKRIVTALAAATLSLGAIGALPVAASDAVTSTTTEVATATATKPTLVPGPTPYLYRTALQTVVTTTGAGSITVVSYAYRHAVTLKASLTVAAAGTYVVQYNCAETRLPTYHEVRFNGTPIAVATHKCK